jgi:uncharacterized protein (DUF1501 family)
MKTERTHRLTIRGIARRDLLKAVGAGLLTLPFASVARAAVRPDAPAKRILIVNLTGGIRSSAAFLASAQARYNPWGLIEGVRTPMALGALLDDHIGRAPPLSDAEYRLDPASGWSGAQLPRFREIAAAGAFSVLGTWHPERGDHLRARVEEPTGSADGAEPGILVRLYGGLIEVLERGSALEVPPIHIHPSATFGLARGDAAKFAPVALSGPEALPSASDRDPLLFAETGRAWASGDAMRDRIDEGVVSRRAGFARELVSVFASHRRAARTIGEKLAAPFVNVARGDAVTASLGTVEIGAGGSQVPLTNAMLRELFVRALGVDPASGNAEIDPNYPSAIDAATAVRLLQFGSPAVALEIGSFDFHSGERRDGPPLYRFIGRLWATLYWLLSRIPDVTSPGASMLDTTLVVTMSDFGRDPGGANGFNGGEGSDHGTDASCFYLAHAIMGAGVRGGRLVGGVRTDAYDARREHEHFGPRDLLATMLWAIGLEYRAEPWGFPDVSSPIQALWAA